MTGFDAISPGLCAYLLRPDAFESVTECVVFLAQEVPHTFVVSHAIRLLSDCRPGVATTEAVFYLSEQVTIRRIGGWC